MKLTVKTEAVIVLNGSYHNSLTIVRSLARRGIPVIVGDKDRGIKSYFGEAMLSRYVAHRFSYPSPDNFPREFIEKINEVSKKYKANVLFPVGANTYVTVSAFRNYLSRGIMFVLADDDLIQKAHDKYRCLKFAESIGVHIPKTVLLRDIDGEKSVEDFGCPLVVKPRKGAGNFGVQIIDNVDQLIKLKRNVNAELSDATLSKKKNSLIYDDSDPIVQEFIEGPVFDACAIADHGEIKAILTQERLKTLPPSGGYGVMNRTIYIPEIKEMAEHLLKSMSWHGLAQVEFKYDPKTDTYRLMEINPKFWGTLAISVAAGVDFPYMAYQMAIGERAQPVKEFKEGCVYRWVLPNELLHVLQSNDRRCAFGQYIKDFFKPAYYNIDIKDPLPMLSLVLKFINKIPSTF